MNKRFIIAICYIVCALFLSILFLQFRTDQSSPSYIKVIYLETGWSQKTTASTDGGSDDTRGIGMTCMDVPLPVYRGIPFAAEQFYNSSCTTREGDGYEQNNMAKALNLLTAGILVLIPTGVVYVIENKCRSRT